VLEPFGAEEQRDERDVGTWLESMACSENPVPEQSKLASVTSSRIASRTFLRRLPCTSRSSNIVAAARPLSGTRGDRGNPS
jgi:hypothetical protein